MGGYFGFERMITTTFVKALHFLGFIAVTAAGVALAVWAGMQLNNATISRALGWRYVAFGVALLVLGNVVWRVFCELWIVLFGIHAQLASVRHALNLAGRPTNVEPIPQEEPFARQDTAGPRQVVIHSRKSVEPRHTGVLGLS